MSDVVILATKPKGQFFPIVSWGIRLLEQSKQSHVSFCFEKENIVRHAHFNDIEEVSFAEFVKTNTIVNMKRITLDEVQYQKLNAFTKSKIGKQKGYFLTLFGEFIPLIVRQLTGKLMKNYLVKGQICSEFVRAGLRQINPVLVFLLTHDIPEGTFNTTDALHLAEEFLKIHNQ